MSNQIKHRKLGTEPLVGLYYVSECIKCGWIGSSGELTEDDAQCLQPVGDDHCWGDTDEIGADRLLELMQSGAFDKPAAQHQGDPVAVGRFSFIGNGFVRVRLNGAAPLLESQLYAEQPAPVAVVLPFAEKVIAKLQRFEACASDGQDVDIDRHWFDLLTQLELLRRVQRSPAYWEMTQQGQDVLEAIRLNSPL
ncbi:hypothetical protein [Pseudomonas helleri]|uniref:hypothetical protein n=1 Tax=Pseudomonas helleri TaxID=1608996 RepID=UPI0030DA1C7E